MGTNYITISYEKNGTKGKKTFTGSTSSEARRKADEWASAHGAKITCRSSGSR